MSDRMGMMAGLGLVGLGAALNASHLTEPWSMEGAAIAGLALGAAMATPFASRAWGQGKRLLPSLVVAGIVLGEAFGLVSVAERVLSAREERAREAAAIEMRRTSVGARLTAAEASVEMAAGRLGAAIEVQQTASSTLASKASDKSCASNCRALAERLLTDASSAVESARADKGLADRELVQARAAVEAVPVRREAHLLASALGIDPRWIDVVLAGSFGLGLNLLGFSLLALTAHGPAVPAAPAPARLPKLILAGDEPRPSTPKADNVVPMVRAEGGGRADEVRAFCKAFLAEHGREPSFSEVRLGTKLAPSTISTYRAKVLFELRSA